MCVFLCDLLCCVCKYLRLHGALLPKEIKNPKTHIECALKWKNATSILSSSYFAVGIKRVKSRIPFCTAIWKMGEQIGLGEGERKGKSMMGAIRDRTGFLC